MGLEGKSQTELSTSPNTSGLSPTQCLAGLDQRGVWPRSDPVFGGFQAASGRAPTTCGPPISTKVGPTPPNFGRSVPSSAKFGRRRTRISSIWPSVGSNYPAQFGQHFIESARSRHGVCRTRPKFGRIRPKIRQARARARKWQAPRRAHSSAGLCREGRCRIAPIGPGFGLTQNSARGTPFRPNPSSQHQLRGRFPRDSSLD